MRRVWNVLRQEKTPPGRLPSSGANLTALPSKEVIFLLRTYVRDPAGFSAASQIFSGARGFGGRDVREPAGRIGNSAKVIYGGFRRKAPIFTRSTLRVIPNSEFHIPN